MSRRIGIIFITATFAALTAGDALSKPPEKVIEPVEGKGAVELNWTNPAEQKTLTAATPKPVTPPPMKPSAPTNPPVSTWTPLKQWADEHQLKPPRLFATGPETAYTIESTNGTMILGIGSREVTWNGIELNLGFAPQLIDDEIYLHGLDLKKNLEPLLCEPSLTFETNRVIVIDPGHGGANVGTHSVLDGRFEKEFTLDWALRLKPLLETNGWTVFLTRTADVEVTNADRVVLADAKHADVYVSLHFNATADRDQRTSGLETYCVTPAGMPSTLTRTYADPWYVHLPANDFDDQNLRLAARMHSALIRGTGLEDRGVCRARFMTVLQGQHCPAILIEAGYLSNPHEAKLIESAEYRQKLAETVAAALR